MTSLTDVSFLIPIRVDSIIRLENVLASIKFLLAHFNTNIIVLEANKYNNHILEELLPKQVQYIFVEDWDPIFHRTKYINEMFSKVDSKIISIWDADIIIPKEQIVKSIATLRSDCFEVSFPYDGTFYDVPDIIRELVIENLDISVLDKCKNKFTLPYGPNMGGGALFITSEAFINSNKEDERFYGWGPEDWNRMEKWKVLNYRIHRTTGSLYHLSHPRDINGRHSWSGQKAKSFYYLEQTKNSSPEELGFKL